MAPPPASSSASLGDLYSKCVQMVNENKISTKNAFNLPLIDHIEDIVQSFMGGSTTKSSSSGGGGSGRASSGGSSMIVSAEGAEGDENRFHEASCTIEASARIYSCRVDIVHIDTYRVLGGLSSADLGDDDGQEGEDGNQARKRRRICGVNTLERNEKNIVQTNIEADEQSDPTFRRMAAAFDAGGAKGLLLSHLPLAEDLSLVFNGDVALSRAKGAAQSMFTNVGDIPQNELGFGDDTQAVCARIASARLCPEVDAFRRQLLGAAIVSGNQVLPDHIDQMLTKVEAAGPGAVHESALVPAMGGGFGGPPGAAQPPGLPDMDMPGPLDDAEFPEPDVDFPPIFGGLPGPSGEPVAVQPPGEGRAALPLVDADLSIVALPQNEDVIAFDELFQKFCGGGKGHQFAYFDECWSKLGRDKDGKAGQPAEDPAVGGELVAVDAPLKEKPAKRPLFDLSSIDKPPKPIETEPVQKHQLSERAMHWQLHKDVPPYMIDRITMPSWPTWSKCDFACLGLRPHLMLKLVKKQAPDTPGPHSFSDLFSTVVVENPEAFPWLASEARGSAGASGRDDEDGAPQPADDMGEDMGNDDVDGNGLPSHLDVDPQDLFLQPDDRVLPGVAGDDMPDVDAGGGVGFDDGFGADPFAPDDNPLAATLDFDMADAPQTVGNTEINYSRNSKFVDVKLVKKHLWDCISEDIEAAKKDPQVGQSSSSFQGLVTRIMKRLPAAECENLSSQVCFICALHLCNEKGIELKTKASNPFGDFAVVGPPP